MSQPPIPAGSGTAAVSENERGSLVQDSVARDLGILRYVTETFSVGGFRYTNLPEAVAQARRMTRLEAELLA